MPKLNLKSDFITKLNNINKQKLIPKYKTGNNDSFKITARSKTCSDLKIHSKKSNIKKIVEKKIKDNISKNIDKNIKKDIIIKDLNDVNLMWNSFDDSIKKIIINEIIEKFYFYKDYKLNIKSFILGFFFCFMIIFLLKILE